MRKYSEKTHSTGIFVYWMWQPWMVHSCYDIYSSLVHCPTLRHKLSKRHTHHRSLSHMHLICIYAMRASGKTQTSSPFSLSTQFQIHQSHWHSTSCHRLCNSQTYATFKWLFLVSSILVFVNWIQFKLSSIVFYVTFIYFFFCVNFIYFRVLCAVNVVCYIAMINDGKHKCQK